MLLTTQPLEKKNGKKQLKRSVLQNICTMTLNIPDQKQDWLQSERQNINVKGKKSRV